MSIKRKLKAALGVDRLGEDGDCQIEKKREGAEIAKGNNETG